MMGIAVVHPDSGRLVDYGIRQEASTHRIHVDLEGGYVFAYRTQDGIAALPPDPLPDNWEDDNYYMVLPPWAKDEFATARGARLDWRTINACQKEEIPAGVPRTYENDGKTIAKAKAAVRVATKMLADGRIRLPISVTEIDERTQQILGIDGVGDELKLQIKCDNSAAKRGLFIQTHEYNPYRWH